MGFGTYSSFGFRGSSEPGGASDRSAALVIGPPGTAPTDGTEAAVAGERAVALAGGATGATPVAGSGGASRGGAAAAVAVVRRVATANRFMASWCVDARRSPSPITRCSLGRRRALARSEDNLPECRDTV